MPYFVQYTDRPWSWGRHQLRGLAPAAAGIITSYASPFMWRRQRCAAVQWCADNLELLYYMQHRMYRLTACCMTAQGKSLAAFACPPGRNDADALADALAADDDTCAVLQRLRGPLGGCALAGCSPHTNLWT